MSYHSALHRDLMEAEEQSGTLDIWTPLGLFDDEDSGPPFEHCDVCGQRSQYAIDGDCWAADCPRTAAINQMDPPADVLWLAVLDTDGERRTWQVAA